MKNLHISSFLLAFSLFGMQINSDVFDSCFLCFAQVKSCERQEKMVLQIYLRLAPVAREEKGLFSDSRQRRRQEQPGSGHGTCMDKGRFFPGVCSKAGCYSNPACLASVVFSFRFCGKELMAHLL